MPGNGDAKKLVGLLVPESASSTTQGPRLRRENGRFAPGRFEEVKLAVLPEEEVQWLFENLSLVVEGILMLDDKLSELRGAVGKLQGSVDQIILRLDRDLIVDLEHASKLLKRADRMGEGAREFLSANEKDIVSPLRKVEMGVEGRLDDPGLPPEVRVCLMRRFLMLRHVQAKVSLACGEGSEAHKLLEETRSCILSLAGTLLDELTRGVAVLDTPEADSTDNELKLLRLMELIDGEAPDDRRFRLRKSIPTLPDGMTFVPLRYKPQDEQGFYPVGTPGPILGKRVQKGQVVCRDQNAVWVAQTSGYLVARDCDLSSIASVAYYSLHPLNYVVLEIPELEAPRPGLSDLIADLASVVDYARRLEAEMDMASGNDELAKKLFASDGREPLGVN